MLLKIRKGKTELTVSEGAFNNFYKRSGWKVAFEQGEEEPLNVHTHDEPCETCGKFPCECEPDTQYDEDEEEDEGDSGVNNSASGTNNALTDEELLEIPVDDMTKKQTKRAAEILKIDWRGMGIKNTKDLKELVKQKLTGG